MFALWLSVCRADLDPAVEFRVDQLGLELEFEVVILRVRAEEGGSESFFGGSDDGAVFDAKRAALVAFGPAIKVLAVEEIDPFPCQGGKRGEKKYGDCRSRGSPGALEEVQGH